MSNQNSRHRLQKTLRERATAIRSARLADNVNAQRAISELPPLTFELDQQPYDLETFLRSNLPAALPSYHSNQSADAILGGSELN